MKKYFILAAAALAFAACTSDEIVPQQVQETIDDGAVRFDAYVNRGVTRAGTPGSIDNTALATGTHTTDGFGVLAYYTNNTVYSQDATPNFMYNQQVKYDGGVWKYDPVKYWPNEFGTSAISDDVDKVSFFAYAPYIPVTAETGVPTGDKEKNITLISKNTAKGDPIVKYVVDTDPTTSVDLLWGVAPASDTYQAIEGTTAAPTLTAGLPYIDLVKAQAANRVKFNFRHALAKLNVQIDAFVDEISAVKELKPETRIYVRSITIGGFAVKGALNLNNTYANEPLWLEYDGSKELTASSVTYYDGRKDGKEATANGEQKSEKPATLNSVLIEDENTFAAGTWGLSAKAGVTKDAVNLFEGGGAGGYIYVIPTGEQMDVTIVYDVETIDPNLSGYLADGSTHGSSVENRIYKENVFSGNIVAGKAYQLKLHLGMTSVKFDAEVIDWDLTAGTQDVDLPHNTRSVYMTPSASEVAAAGGNVALSAQLGDGTPVALSGNAYEGTITTKGVTTPLSAGTLTGSEYTVTANSKVYKNLYNIKLTDVSYGGATYETNSVSITQAPAALALDLSSTTITTLSTTTIDLAAATTGVVDDWTTDANITITVNGTPLVKPTDFDVDAAGLVTLTNPATAGTWVISVKAGDAALETGNIVAAKLAGTLNSFAASNKDYDNDDYVNASTAITGTQTTTLSVDDGSITYSIARTTGSGANATINPSTGAVTFDATPTAGDVYTVTATVADGVNYTYTPATVTYTITITD